MKKKEAIEQLNLLDEMKALLEDYNRLLLEAMQELEKKEQANE